MALDATLFEAQSSPFFVAGGTLHRDATCYVSRQADVDLLAGLRDGQFCYVLTSRQMGKSSLMIRTAVLLQEDGVQIASLDLTAHGKNLSAEQWYYGLLTSLDSQLHLNGALRNFWRQSKEIGPLQRFMEALRQVALEQITDPLVIFVDEIDVVRSLAFSTDEFFAAIRECYNRRTQDAAFQRLTFCLLGVATPSDLIRDTRMTPFNIGKRIELQDFTLGEALPLARGLGRSLEQGEALLRRILYWTGGHPYLTQRLCQEVAQAPTQSSPADVDQFCRKLFLSPRSSERDDNLLFVRERLLRSEVDLAGLLDLYAKVRSGRHVADDETNPMVSILRLAGIVRMQRGRLSLRNHVYEQVFDRAWIAANMPDAEVQRQRAAFRKGVLRTVTVSGVILVAMIGLVLAVLREKQRSDIYALLAKEAEYRARLSAQEARSQADAAQSSAILANRNERAAQVNAALAERHRKAAIQAQDMITRLANQRKTALDVALTARLHADRETQRALRAEAHVRQEIAEANRLLKLDYVADINLVEEEWYDNDFGHALELLKETRTNRERNFEWGYWNRLCHLDLKTFPNTGAPAAFSPDGRTIFTNQEPGTGLIWDARTWHVLVPLEGKRVGVHAAAFSPDSKRLVTANSDHTAIIWDTATGRRLLTITDPTSNILVVAFSPDSQHILTGNDDKTAHVWDAPTGKELLTLKGHTNSIWAVAYSPDGKHIVTGSGDDTAKVWDAVTGKELLTLKGHTGSVFAVAYSPDRGRIVTGSYDNSARVWDAVSGQQVFSLGGHTNSVLAVAYSPDGRRIVTGSYDNTAKVWDATTGKEIMTLSGHSSPVTSVSYSPDGKHIITGSSDKTAKVWDATVDRQVLTLQGHKGRIHAVAFSSDGKRIITGSDDKTAKVWDAATGKELLTLKGHTNHVEAAAFSPDNKHIVTGSSDKTAKIWDAATGKELLTLKGHANSIFAMAYSPDGKRIITGSDDKTAKIWDAATGKELLTLKGHTGSVPSVAYSPDGMHVVTGSDDNTARVWDATTGKQQLTLKYTSPIFAVAYSPDGKRIVTGSRDDTAEVWDAATGKKLLTLKGPTNAVWSVAYSPDGKRIVAGSNDETAYVWDAATGKQVLSLEGHTEGVTSAAFSPDGRSLVTGSWDGTAKVWETSF